MSQRKFSKGFMTLVVLAGLVCIGAAIAALPVDRFDIYFVILFCFTIGLGSRITVQIPRFKSHIAVSDIFIFLALLVYGGEYAVILSAVEAFASSWRFCNKKITVFFNAATMAVSTTAVVLVLKGLGLYTESQLHGNGANRQNFVIALSVIALTQFIVNTSFATIYDSLNNGGPFWEIWKTKYIWTFFTYFVGIGGAAVLVQASEVIGFGIIIATFPVIFFVFLSYRMYLKNVEISVQHAEQAEQYAKILEEQSAALRESEERFRSAFDHAPIGIGLVSPLGNWLRVNHALIEILGYSKEEFLATNFQSLTLPDDLGASLIKVHDLLTGKLANYQMEQRYIHRTGRTVWASWSVSAAADTTSTQPNLIFQIQDITEKKNSEEKLQHDATHDALTGLPNRSFFMDRLSGALEKVREIDDYRVSVLFIDLDRFKYVNDSLGHIIGDELLKEIASRLRDCMRPSDIVARLGGDEFTILVEGTSGRLPE
ncbi:MAG: diguanylate cyclase [Pyrinomonadaceae bacterium]